ncbi:hypothetical protein GGX14DRAFT_395112 [Mycena pura]|uniref:Uncharacterized protein n=1 Tax=Mycena pura TaxID=153505 RepID=A0AAD6YBC3_9AGAR|nr:hypothetical protein GGX14DRAFT_395112 [Mycena pura]
MLCHARSGRDLGAHGGSQDRDRTHAKRRSGLVGMCTKMVLGTLPALPADASADSATESDTSAWGALSGNEFHPRMSVTNSELDRRHSPPDAQNSDAVVAWERPAQRYIKGDTPQMQGTSPYSPVITPCHGFRISMT